MFLFTPSHVWGICPVIPCWKRHGYQLGSPITVVKLSRHSMRTQTWLWKTYLFNSKDRCLQSPQCCHVLLEHYSVRSWDTSPPAAKQRGPWQLLPIMHFVAPGLSFVHGSRVQRKKIKARFIIKSTSSLSAAEWHIATSEIGAQTNFWSAEVTYPPIVFFWYPSAHAFSQVTIIQLQILCFPVHQPFYHLRILSCSKWCLMHTPSLELSTSSSTRSSVLLTSVAQDYFALK